MPAVGPPREKFIEFPMKRPGLTPHLCAATLFLAGALGAEEAKPAVLPAKAPGEAGPAPLTMKPGRAEDILRRFDKNGDGKLDEDEQADAHEVMLKEQLARPVARPGPPDGAPPFGARLLELFDKNHDGRLDDDERAAARNYAEERGLGENGAVRAELIRRFDRDGDGKLDAEESAALITFLLDHRPPAVVKPTPAAELERLERVAAEVARRRALREKAGQQVEKK